MISNEMFGGDIIRVSVNGYLKNNTDGENTVFKEKGIRTKDKLSFVFDDVKYSIKINDNDIKRMFVLLVPLIVFLLVRKVVKVIIILRNMVIL